MVWVIQERNRNREVVVANTKSYQTRVLPGNKVEAMVVVLNHYRHRPKVAFVRLLKENLIL
jgi:hypothetical protein